MTGRHNSISSQALLIASIVAGGCATTRPNELDLPVSTSHASFLKEVHKTAELMAKCAALQSMHTREAEDPNDPYYQMPRQIKAVYRYFAWQLPDHRKELINMLHGFHNMQNCPNKAEMQVVIEGLEELSQQIAVRDAAIDKRFR